MRIFPLIKTLLITAVVAIIVIVIFNVLFIKYLASQEKEPIDTTRYSKIVPPDYLNILNLKKDYPNDPIDNKFEFVNTVLSKFRMPITTVIYDKKYYLQICKMDSASNSSLEDIITMNLNDAKISIYTPYSIVKSTPIEYRFKLTRPLKPTKIFVTLDGKESRELIRNDSVVYYYSEMTNFSIKYKPTGLYDIYGQTDETSDPVKYLPLEILFLKRNNSLYLLIMSINKEYMTYQRGLLYSLVTNKRID